LEIRLDGVGSTDKPLDDGKPRARCTLISVGFLKNGGTAVGSPAKLPAGWKPHANAAIVSANFELFFGQRAGVVGGNQPERMSVCFCGCSRR